MPACSVSQAVVLLLCCWKSDVLHLPTLLCFHAPSPSPRKNVHFSEGDISMRCCFLSLFFCVCACVFQCALVCARLAHAHSSVGFRPWNFHRGTRDLLAPFARHESGAGKCSAKNMYDSDSKLSFLCFSTPAISCWVDSGTHGK